ncbi:MAG: thioredoxin family protein [Chitinophagales bacterium]|nr:thioredoxin family protein [Chitinophagales bacterium]
MKKINLIVMALFLVVVFTACKQNAKETTEETETVVVEETTPTGYKIGDEATDFSLKNVDGKMVSLADYPDAKGFIIAFTCNHCPYSIAYEDRIIALDAKYKPLGYPVIAINPNDPAVNEDDSFDKMVVRAKEKGFTFPYLFDDGQKIFPQYGATKTPHMFVLNKEDGKNIVRYIGAIDNNYENADDVSEKYVEAAVDALLAGEPVKTETTAAVGCGIKVQE